MTEQPRADEQPSPHRATRPSRLVLLGHPVAHSLSPRFQQAALDAAHLALQYTAHDTPPAALQDVLRELAAEGAAGNVTLPHKIAVHAACAIRTPIAERTGAVNTFWHDMNGNRVGDNTDVAGVCAAIAAIAPALMATDRSSSTAAPRRVALLGAGGVAASVLVALANVPGLTLTIAARSPDKARSLLDRLEVRMHDTVRIVSTAEQAVVRAEVVVNATPIGLVDDAMPIAPTDLSAHVCVLDLVYKRGLTAWVRHCRARGLVADDGLRMLVEQGAASFTAWFGVPPDRDAMWRVLEPRPLPVSRSSVG